MKFGEHLEPRAHQSVSSYPADFLDGYQVLWIIPGLSGMRANRWASSPSCGQAFNNALIDGCFAANLCVSSGKRRRSYG
jgi:hypothetical protein